MPTVMLWAVCSTSLSGATAQPAAPPVAVAPVVEHSIRSEAWFVGTVTPTRVSVVGSAVDGRVLAFPVNEGDRVTAGQTLAQLRTSTQEIELAAAQAELAFRQAELAEAENGLRPEEIAQTRAAMNAAQARHTYAARDLERKRRLFVDRQAADDEIDQAEARAEETQQEYEECKARYELAVAGTRRERLDQARARMAAQEAEVRRIEDIITKHTVIAPFDGYIAREHTETGEWVQRAQAVATVVELDQVDVRVAVSEEFIAFVRPGTPARVVVDAAEETDFAGEVHAVVPQADERSRSFAVLVRVENVEREGRPVLKGGMFARVSLPVGRPTQAILVAKDALVLGGAEALVYVVDPTGEDPQLARVRAVTVVPGAAYGGLIQVMGSIQPGERVVVRGNERLMPGQSVNITATLSETATPAPSGLRPGTRP